MWLLQGAVRRELERASRENGQLQQALVRGFPAQHSGRVIVGSSSCLCLPVDAPEVPRQLTAAWLAAAQDAHQAFPAHSERRPPKAGPRGATVLENTKNYGRTFFVLYY